eukprot:scaffold35716_cov161-Skeletonema_dohrnii-CCMP3373.AAC.1
MTSTPTTGQRDMKMKETEEQQEHFFDLSFCNNSDWGGCSTARTPHSKLDVGCSGGSPEPEPEEALLMLLLLRRKTMFINEEGCDGLNERCTVPYRFFTLYHCCHSFIAVVVARTDHLTPLKSNQGITNVHTHDHEPDD